MYSLISFLKNQPRNAILHAMSMDRNYLDGYKTFLHNKNCRYVVKPIDIYQMVLIDDVPDYMHTDFCDSGVRFAISDNYRESTQIVHAGHLMGKDYGKEEQNIYLIGLNYYGFVKMEIKQENGYSTDGSSKHFVVMFHYNRFVVNCEAVIHELVIVQNDMVGVEQIRDDFKLHHKQLTKHMKSCCYLSERVFDVDAYYENGITVPKNWISNNKDEHPPNSGVAPLTDANLTPEERKEKYLKMGESIVNTIKTMVGEADLSCDGVNVEEKSEVVVGCVGGGVLKCKTMHVKGNDIDADKFASALQKKLPNENISVVKTMEGNAVAINAPLPTNSSMKIVREEVVLPSVKPLRGNDGMATDLFEKPKSKLFVDCV
jgi:hypothetical protein